MRVGRSWKGATALAAVAAAFAVAAPAASACEAFMPTSAVAKGMTGTGLTVERGQTPEPFAVEVLGVLTNAIAPGRDVILVEATSPAIARAGGAWSGMSGSPVYVDGKLIGAVSLGLGSPTGASTVAGLTPAEEMARVLTYPRLRGSAAAGGSADGSVTLPDALAREVAARTGLGPARSDMLTQLKVPFAVSGVPAQGMRFVRRFAEARKLPLIPYVGSSAALGGATGAAGPLRPGDNFAAVASLGDVTTAGVGTTTYVCDGQALAFGHPVEFGGSTTLGANHADALTVVPDRFGGPFKIAAIGDSVGRVDQDRLSAVRASLGEAPDATPIRSTVTAPGLGVRRDGATDSFSPGMTPFLTFLHLMGNIASTFDSIGPGTASVSWSVEGTRAGGASWRLSRSNVYASEWEIASEAAWELAMQLELVVGNPFEDVTLTGVRTTASVEEAVRRYSVRRVLVSTGGPFRARRAVRARPGARVAVRVVLTPFERGRNRRVDFAFRLPRRAQPVGVIEIGGAGGEFGDECLIEEECDGAGPDFRSFDALLRHLARAPRNDVLSATLRLGRRMRVAQERERRLPGVVSGHAFVRIGRGGRGGGGDEEAAGASEEMIP